MSADMNVCASSYRILGLSTDCTFEEAKRAFRRKALQLHPDKNHYNILSECQSAVGISSFSSSNVSQSEFPPPISSSSPPTNDSFIQLRSAYEDIQKKALTSSNYSFLTDALQRGQQSGAAVVHAKDLELIEEDEDMVYGAHQCRCGNEIIVNWTKTDIHLSSEAFSSFFVDCEHCSLSTKVIFTHFVSNQSPRITQQ